MSRCDATTYMGCDPGVTAALPGTAVDLTAKVVACAEAVPESEVVLPYVSVGLMYCGVDLSRPGLYTVIYSVPGYNTPLATRYIIVEAVCAGGQYQCLDGSCADDSPLACGILPITLPQEPPNTAPRVTLATTSVLGTVVKVKEGSMYELCAAGQEPFLSRPCEPGASAQDAEEGNITSRMLLCPPDDCAAIGTCGGHLAAQKTVLDCGINTTAAVAGQVLRLRYVVYDRHLVAASVERLIEIVPYCGTGLHRCGDDCLQVDCDTAAAMAALQAAAQPPNSPPQLTLLLQPNSELPSDAAANATLYLAFGAPSGLTLAPCVGEEQAQAQPLTCGAVAWDPEEGDLTNCTVLDDVTPCASATCPPCTAGMASQGACLPGSYLLRYRVVDMAGLSAEAHIRLIVEERAEVSIVAVVSSGHSDDAQIAQWAGSLMTNTSAAWELARLVMQQSVNGAEPSQLRAVIITLAAPTAPVPGHMGLVRVAMQLQLAVAPSSAAFATARRRTLQGAGSCQGLQVSTPTTQVTGPGAVVSLVPSIPGADACSDATRAVLELDVQLAITARVLLDLSQSITNVFDQAGAMVNAIEVRPNKMDAQVADASQQLTTLVDTAKVANASVLGKLDTAITLFDATLAAQAEAVKLIASIQALQDQSMRVFQSTEAAELDLLEVGTLFSILRLEQSDGSYAADESDYQQYAACLASHATDTTYTLTVQRNATSTRSRRSVLKDSALQNSQDPASSGSTSQHDNTTWLFDAADVSMHWRGYYLPVTDVESYMGMYQALDHNTRDRRLGSTQSTNHLMGGLLLHQIRRRAAAGYLDQTCSVASRFMQLASGCWSNSMQQEAVMQKGIGNDPVFNMKSALYDEYLAKRGPEGFYNMTLGTGEVSANGAPHAFYSEPMPGYAPGWPLFLGRDLTGSRAIDLLRFMRDGRYLDASNTQRMTAEMLAYNPEQAVFGYVRLAFEWDDSGFIDLTMRLAGLPAVAYEGKITSSNWRQFLPDLLLLLTTLVYIPITCYDLALAIHFESRKWKLQKQYGWLEDEGEDDDLDESQQFMKRMVGHSRKSNFWLVFEVVQCSLMIAAMAILYTYVFSASRSARLNKQFEVYDAAGIAPARPFLPLRDDSVHLPGGAAMPLPGQPDRWRLPPAQPSGLQQVAHMMQDAGRMYSLFVVYGMLQAVVLLMLMGRLLSHLSFQPKLGLIANALSLSLSDLVHYAVVMIIVVLMMAVGALVVFGPVDADYSSLAWSLTYLFQLLMDGDEGKAALRALPDIVEGGGLGSAATFLAWVYWLLGGLCLKILLLQYLVGVLLVPFKRLKRTTIKSSTLMEDLSDRLIWLWQVLGKQALSNTQIIALHRLLSNSAPKGGSSRFAELGSKLWRTPVSSVRSLQTFIAGSMKARHSLSTFGQMATQDLDEGGAAKSQQEQDAENAQLEGALLPELPLFSHFLIKMDNGSTLDFKQVQKLLLLTARVHTRKQMLAERAKAKRRASRKAKRASPLALQPLPSPLTAPSLDPRPSTAASHLGALTGRTSSLMMGLESVEAEPSRELAWIMYGGGASTPPMHHRSGLSEVEGVQPGRDVPRVAPDGKGSVPWHEHPLGEDRPTNAVFALMLSEKARDTAEHGDERAAPQLLQHDHNDVLTTQHTSVPHPEGMPLESPLSGRMLVHSRSHVSADGSTITCHQLPTFNDQLPSSQQHSFMTAQSAPGARVLKLYGETRTRSEAGLVQELVSDVTPGAGQQAAGTADRAMHSGPPAISPTPRPFSSPIHLSSHDANSTPRVPVSPTPMHKPPATTWSLPRRLLLAASEPCEPCGVTPQAPTTAAPPPAAGAQATHDRRRLSLHGPNRLQQEFPADAASTAASGITETTSPLPDQRSGAQTPLTHRSSLAGPHDLVAGALTPLAASPALMNGLQHTASVAGRRIRTFAHALVGGAAKPPGWHRMMALASSVMLMTHLSRPPLSDIAYPLYDRVRDPFAMLPTLSKAEAVRRRAAQRRLQRERYLATLGLTAKGVVEESKQRTMSQKFTAYEDTEAASLLKQTSFVDKSERAWEELRASRMSRTKQNRPSASVKLRLDPESGRQLLVSGSLKAPRALTPSASLNHSLPGQRSFGAQHSIGPQGGGAGSASFGMNGVWDGGPERVSRPSGVRATMSRMGASAPNDDAANLLWPVGEDGPVQVSPRTSAARHTLRGAAAQVSILNRVLSKSRPSIFVPADVTSPSASAASPLSPQQQQQQQQQLVSPQLNQFIGGHLIKNAPNKRPSLSSLVATSLAARRLVPALGASMTAHPIISEDRVSITAAMAGSVPGAAGPSERRTFSGVASSVLHLTPGAQWAAGTTVKPVGSTIAMPSVHSAKLIAERQLLELHDRTSDAKEKSLQAALHWVANRRSSNTNVGISPAASAAAVAWSAGSKASTAPHHSPRGTSATSRPTPGPSPAAAAQAGAPPGSEPIPLPGSGSASPCATPSLTTVPAEAGSSRPLQKRPLQQAHKLSDLLHSSLAGMPGLTVPEASTAGDPPRLSILNREAERQGGTHGMSSVAGKGTGAPVSMPVASTSVPSGDASILNVAPAAISGLERAAMLAVAAVDEERQQVAQVADMRAAVTSQVLHLVSEAEAMLRELQAMQANVSAQLTNPRTPATVYSPYCSTPASLTPSGSPGGVSQGQHGERGGLSLADMHDAQRLELRAVSLSVEQATPPMQNQRGGAGGVASVFLATRARPRRAMDAVNAEASKQQSRGQGTTAEVPGSSTPAPLPLSLDVLPQTGTNLNAGTGSSVHPGSAGHHQAAVFQDWTRQQTERQELNTRTVSQWTITPSAVVQAPSATPSATEQAPAAVEAPANAGKGPAQQQQRLLRHPPAAAVSDTPELQQFVERLRTSAVTAAAPAATSPSAQSPTQSHTLALRLPGRVERLVEEEGYAGELSLAASGRMEPSLATSGRLGTGDAAPEGGHAPASAVEVTAKLEALLLTVDVGRRSGAGPASGAGRVLSSDVFANLEALQRGGHTPRLLPDSSVLLVGQEPSSVADRLSSSTGHDSAAASLAPAAAMQLLGVQQGNLQQRLLALAQASRSRASGGVPSAEGGVQSVGTESSTSGSHSAESPQAQEQQEHSKQ